MTRNGMDLNGKTWKRKGETVTRNGEAENATRRNGFEWRRYGADLIGDAKQRIGIEPNSKDTAK